MMNMIRTALIAVALAATAACVPGAPKDQLRAQTATLLRQYPYDPDIVYQMNNQEVTDLYFALSDRDSKTYFDKRRKVDAVLRRYGYID